MDSRTFDELTVALTRPRPSRRLVGGGLLGAAVTAVAGVLPGADADARQHKRKRTKVYKCNEDSCDGTGGKECGRDGCYCYRHRGGYACVKGLVQSDDKRCRKDRQCPGNQVCVKSGPACGDGKGFCKRLCRKK